MLYQMHWQFRNGTTEMRAQREFKCETSYLEQFIITADDKKAFDDWVDEVIKNHLLPEGAVWMLCNEDSRHFVGTIKED